METIHRAPRHRGKWSPCHLSGHQHHRTSVTGHMFIRTRSTRNNVGASKCLVINQSQITLFVHLINNILRITDNNNSTWCTVVCRKRKAKITKLLQLVAQSRKKSAQIQVMAQAQEQLRQNDNNRGPRTF